MAQVVIDVNVDRNIFARYEVALVPSSLLKLIGVHFTGFMTRRFSDDGASEEFGLPAWEPLKPSTIAMRRKQSSRPLQDTGRLRQTYLAQPQTDNNTYVEIGSNQPYASWHDDGTKPYEIHAKNGRMLAAKLATGGWIRFGKVVNHPGVPQRKVLPTVTQAEVMMLEEFESMLEPLDS